MSRILGSTLIVTAIIGSVAAAQGAWSTPVEVTAVNTTTQDYYPNISRDGLTLRIASSRSDLAGFVGGWDINAATRSGPGQSWVGLQTEPGTINSTSNDLSPHVLPGDTVAYFASLRPGTGGSDIWRVSRAAPNQPWGNATEITPVNTTTTEYGVSVTDDELYMLLTSGSNIVESTRASIALPWGAPVVVSELNIGTSQRDTRVSGDGLTVYFASNGNLFVSRRPFRTAKWGTPVSLGSVNSTGTDRVPSPTSDGRELFFSSSRPGTGGQDVWVTTFTGLSYEGLPQVGSPLLLHVTHPARPGAIYQIGLSFSNTIGIPIPGVGTIPLDFDKLFEISVVNPIPGLFQNFSNTLNVRGESTAVLSIPPIGALIGVSFHAAFVTLGTSGVDYISNGLQLGIHR